MQRQKKLNDNRDHENQDHENRSNKKNTKRTVTSFRRAKVWHRYGRDTELGDDISDASRAVGMSVSDFFKQCMPNEDESPRSVAKFSLGAK